MYDRERDGEGYRVFGQISSKMKRREFSIFITFSDAYTCTYVV